MHQDVKMNWRRWVVGDFTFRRLLCSLLEVYLCIVACVLLFSDRIIFQPPAAEYGPGDGVFCIPARDNNPLAVFALTNTIGSTTVLYVHGNAEDIGGVRDFLLDYQSAGFAVFTFDYRGYGISGGRPSCGNACEDVETVYDYLLQQHKIDPAKLIVHGRSLGAAVALHLASHRNVGGVIVESAFITAFRSQTQVPVIPFDKLRNDRAIRRLKCPVLVIHGQADTTIRFWQGKRLYELAPDPKYDLWIPAAGHDDVPYVDSNSYFASLCYFRDVVRKAP